MTTEMRKFVMNFNFKSIKIKTIFFYLKLRRWQAEVDAKFLSQLYTNHRKFLLDFHLVRVLIKFFHSANGAVHNLSNQCVTHSAMCGSEIFVNLRLHF